MSLLMRLRVTLFYLLLASSAGIWCVLVVFVAPFLSTRWRIKVIIEWWTRERIYPTSRA